LADPYGVRPRGSDENTNGLAGQYFPESTNFNDITDKNLAFVAKKLNHRPKKSSMIRRHITSFAVPLVMLLQLEITIF
jgi:IS30 family transposase